MTPVSRLRKGLFLSAVLLCLATSARGEVTLDGSMGNGGSLAGPHYAISGDLGTVRGTNLFHSFSAFNIATAESATFSGPDGIANIISRVSGQRASTIDGLLRTEIPGANLYLVNPHGLLFGPNAQLDIPGSFYATTADYLRLGETGRFDARNPDNTLLSTAPPSAFGFLSTTPQSVTIDNARLNVSTGKELSIIAGEIDAVGDGHLPLLSAPGGAVNLVGTGAGEVSTGFGRAAFSRPDAGTVTVAGTAEGGLPRMLIDTSSPQGTGGRVYISAGRFFLDRAGISSRVAGAVDGGGITVTADDVTISNGLIKTSTTGRGAAGDIRLEAGSITVGNVSQISSVTGLPFDPTLDGPAGDITLRAAGKVQIDGQTRITSETLGTSNAGEIAIDAATIHIGGDSYLSTSSPIEYARGHAGNITVKAAGQVLIDGNAYLFSTTSGSGDAGDIGIDAGFIHIGGESYLSSGADNPRYDGGTISGNGGNLTLRAVNQVLIDGAAFLESITEGSGNAGDIRIEAGSIHATGDGFISSAAADEFGFTAVSGAAGSITLISRDQTHIDGRFRVRSNTKGSGNAGDITIDAGTIHIGEQGTIISNSADRQYPYATGHAGNISLLTGGDLLVDGTARITSEAFDRGNAGRITLRAATFNLLGEGYVSTYTNHLANAGSIRIEAEQIHLGEKSTVNSSAIDDIWGFGVSGHAGTVTLLGDTVTIDGNSRVLTTTQGSGNAGTITIQARTMTLNHGEVSTATSASGAGGAISVTAKSLSLANEGRLTAASTGAGGGVAGSIRVQTSGHITLTGGSAIETATSDADGGDIQLDSGGYLSLRQSSITTSVRGGSGDGGNIAVHGGAVALNHSTIMANAYGGNGGNIAISADPLIEDQSSAITASSVYGLQGVIGIDTPLVDLGGSLADLPEGMLADDLKPRNCATVNAADYSFIIRDSAQPGQP